MIDLLAALAAFAFAIFWLTRTIRAPRLAQGFAIASAASLALCIGSLYCQPAGYEYVVWPSPAGLAGLQGGGAVRSVNGTPVGSLGSFLHVAAAANAAEIAAPIRFHRDLNGESPWSFWNALDSYELEELTGGLAVFPRRPIYQDGNSILSHEVPYLIQSNSFRILAVQGAATPTIGRLEQALADFPAQGVASLRVMAPSPDGNTATLYYAPAAIPTPFVPGRPAETASAIAQIKLGLSGLPILVLNHEGHVLTSRIYSLGGAAVYGPAGLAAALNSQTEARDLIFSPDSAALLAPRLTLLPRLYASPFSTLLLAIPGAYVRQLLRIPDLRFYITFGSFFPRQLYRLDDNLSVPALFFRLSSLAASMALACGLLFCLNRYRQSAMRQGNQLAILLVCTLLLQVADLLNFHAY